MAASLSTARRDCSDRNHRRDAAPGRVLAAPVIDGILTRNSQRPEVLFPVNRPDPRAAGGWQPDYAPRLLDSALPSDLCATAIEVASRVGFEPSSVFYGDEPADNPEYRRSETAWLTPEQLPELYRHTTRMIQTVNDQLYRFSIYGMDQIQIIRYLPGCFFVDHTDIAHAHAAHRKISLIVQLSDAHEYEGGDVVLAGGVRVPKQRGSGCVFPSWVQHRVDAITSGTRYSLAAWAKGAWFH
jgi:PKHD-type hydroxylase